MITSGFEYDYYNDFKRCAIALFIESYVKVILISIPFIVIE